MSEVSKAREQTSDGDRPSLDGTDPSQENAGWNEAAGRVVVLGSGMAGLATALSLKNSGREVILLERDDPPPSIAPETAFDAWKRPGVPQLHHTHIFLSRLRTILRDDHPEVLAELDAVGIHRSSIDQILPPSLVERYQPAPGDDDFLHLWGRRATLEFVLRRHVDRLPNVRVLHGVRVESLDIERENDRVRVRGVHFKRAGKDESIRAEVVVDASGARSRSPEWLRQSGVEITTDAKPSACAYYCRHFQQRDPSTEPPRRGTGANIDYLIYGIFFAENGSFSIAFACPEMEETLADAVKRPEGFDHVCSQIPALARWTSRAEPVSRVLGGASLSNRWHVYPEARNNVVLGFFPVGDSHIQTNPIYGRGCSMAFVQAKVLAEVLAKDGAPEDVASGYFTRVRTLLKPHFDFSRTADQAFLARARMARGDTVSFAERLMSYLYEEAFAPIIEVDLRLAREWLKASQMREVSPPWVGLALAVRMFFLWCWLRLTGRLKKLPSFGPPRAAMLASLPPAKERLAADS
jgi:2-polyprenyl-6-methoxyphenol hydroxylase-like FAD-dependent oxidoreductase